MLVLVLSVLATLAVATAPTHAALTSFSDVDTNAHRWSIKAVEDAGITRGCEPGRYCPRRAITRAQVATFLARALGLQPRSNSFSDVPSNSPHAGSIGAIAHAGITQGCGSGRFCPDDPLTRAQMATLLARALSLASGSVSGFSDVGSGHTHARGIGAVASAGITQGCRTGRYCPDGIVTRDQMATFLARALDLDRGLEGCPAVGPTTDVRFGAAARGLPLSAGERIGDTIYTFSLDVEPARLTSYNTDSGNIETITIPQGRRTWASTVMNDRLYFGVWGPSMSTSPVYEYNPSSKTLRTVTTISTSHEFWALTSDGQNTLYAGTARSNRVTRIDLSTSPPSVTDLPFNAPPGAASADVTSLVHADETLYIGVGRGIPRLVRYDLTDGSNHPIQLPPAIQDDGGGGIYAMASSDDYLVVGTQQEQAVLTVLDRTDDYAPIHTAVFDGTTLPAEPVVSAVSIDGGRIVAAGNGTGNLYELDLSAGDPGVVDQGAAFSLVPTRSMTAVGSDLVGVAAGGKLWIRELADLSTVRATHDLAPGSSGMPLLPQSLSISSTDTLVGTNGTVFLRRLSDTASTWRASLPGEPKTSVAVGDTHYVANYPHGTLWRVRWGTPPELIADWQGQNRPAAMAHDPANGRVVIVGLDPFLDLTPGIVSVRLSDGQVRVHENVLGSVTLESVAIHGNNAIIGGGGGAHPSTVAAVNPQTGAVRWQTSNVANGARVRGLEVVGDRLYGITNSGWLFELDARSGAQLSTPVRVLTSGSVGELTWKAGTLYAVSTDRVVAVDPVTKAVHVVSSGLAADLFGTPPLRTDANCRLYALQGRDLRRLEHDIWAR